MKRIRYGMIVIAIAFIMVAAPVANVRADCAFQITLEKSVPNAVFSLYYEGEVSTVSLKSPSGAAVNEATYPGSYLREEKILRVGLSSAEAGVWRIQILGKPADGFQILVMSEPGFAGTMAVIEAIAASNPEPTVTDPLVTQGSETVPETITSEVPETSPTEETSSIAGVTRDSATQIASEETSGEDSITASLPTHESVLSAVADVTRSVTEGEKDDIEEVINIIEGKMSDSSSQEKSEPLPVNTALDTRSSDKTLEETLAGMDRVLEKYGVMAYALCSIPLLLSALVVVFDFISSKCRKTRKDPVKEKILSLFRRKRNPPRAGKHASVLWRTSTWQEPSERR